MQQLKLPQSVASFQAAYTVTILTANVLTINVGAPSSAAAMQRASALATAFLQYRAQYARTQEQQLFAQLDQQYNAAQQRLQLLKRRVSQIPTRPTPAQKAEWTPADPDEPAGQIIQYVTGTKSTAKTVYERRWWQAATCSTPPPRSRARKLRAPALYVVGGLFGGLVVGMAIVIISALLSRGLRRREDVAVALGAPVRLSVGPLRARRWRLTLPRQAAKRKLDMKRVVTYLRGAVPGSSRGPASLAVVAVDDAQVVAQAVASLAASCAARGEAGRGGRPFRWCLPGAPAGGQRPWHPPGQPERREPRGGAA